MDRMYLRVAHSAEANQIVQALQKQQFIRPHQGVVGAVAVASREVGFCPAAAAQALQWLQLDADKAVGRLRASELMQIARSILRFWRGNAARPDIASQSHS